MKIAGMALAVVLVAGCASVAVTSDSMEDRTAFALGMNKSDFTISNRQDNGVRTDYTVQAKNGAQYNCYVTGGVSLVGRSVSDAICSQVSGPKKAAEPAAKPTSCNALLKSAGKC